MKYKVLGQNITNVFKVEICEDKNGIPFRKPEFVPEKQIEWEEILSFEAEPTVLNSSPLYIGDDDRVNVIGRRFRADEGIVYLKTSKILSERDDKETYEEEYKRELKKYYEFVLEQNPDVKEHIEIYNPKNPEENIEKIMKEVKGTVKQNPWTDLLALSCSASPY